MESVYCVETGELKKDFSPSWGKSIIISDVEDLSKSSISRGKFINRDLVEDDPTHKQIIPYVVFVRANQVFVMERSSDINESRLANKASIGVGGHVNTHDCPDDINRLRGQLLFGLPVSPPDEEGALNLFSIQNGMWREIIEEINISGRIMVEKNKRVGFIGILWDDMDSVGKVHLGLLVLFRLGIDEDISVKGEHKTGKFLHFDEVLVRTDLEGWSDMAVTIIAQCV